MEVTTIAIDLAKNVFALCGADADGQIVVRKELRRAQLSSFMRKLGPGVIGMEASGGAHHWARQMAAMGHEVRLISPALVKPYRKGNKTDRNDAEAILEAMTRPTMRFVAIKSVAQQDMLALHRVRSQLVKTRTALCNQFRGLLRERGVVVRTGPTALKRALPQVLADESNELSGELRDLLCEMSEWLRTLEQRIASCEAKISRAFKNDERCARLTKVPGVGPLAATALVAAIGNAQEFKSGRELSAFLGLVPRQHSSGGKRVLLGITKRGDSYLRTLLIHGARSSLRWCESKDDLHSRWAARVKAARGANVAAVAMANKNARVLWALLSRGDRYRCGNTQGSAVLRPGSPPAVERARVAKLRLSQD
jgi:transposase